jgi:CheY-like chemotaxis protein
LSVVDTGTGMTPETLKRAVEPFFSSKPLGKGTGLGLSMVHGLAEQSGGRLVLRSRKGEGTTAELWLPVAKEQAAAAEAPASVPAEPAQASGPLVILAVDDDALVLMNTAAMLEDLGHTVIEATSGREALAHMANQRVDLVVTDHAMPQMSGTELARVLAADWPGVPVILATGYAELPPGADMNLPKLSKPFSQDELARAVKAALAG